MKFAEDFQTCQLKKPYKKTRCNLLRTGIPTAVYFHLLARAPPRQYTSTSVPRYLYTSRVHCSGYSFLVYSPRNSTADPTSSSGCSPRFAVRESARTLSAKFAYHPGVLARGRILKCYHDIKNRLKMMPNEEWQATTFIKAGPTATIPCSFTRTATLLCGAKDSPSHPTQSPGP